MWCGVFPTMGAKMEAKYLEMLDVTELMLLTDLRGVLHGLVFSPPSPPVFPVFPVPQSPQCSQCSQWVCRGGPDAEQGVVLLFTHQQTGLKHAGVVFLFDSRMENLETADVHVARDKCPTWMRPGTSVQCMEPLDKCFWHE